MDCPAEETLVRMQLRDIEGVEQVAIDLPSREVVVIHDTDSNRVSAALEDLELGSLQLGDTWTDRPEGGVAPPNERVALLVAVAINGAFFVVEFLAGVVANSLGLIADSLDMFADAAVYALSLAAVGHHLRRKATLAAASGWLQLGLAVIGLVEVIRRFITGDSLPDVSTMIVVSVLALLANIAVFALLARIRSGEVHIEASWIFTANDIKVNLVVIAAAVGVWLTDSAAPDLVAGGIIFLVVASGARRIIKLSRSPG